MHNPAFAVIHTFGKGRCHQASACERACHPEYVIWEMQNRMPKQRFLLIDEDSWIRLEITLPAPGTNTLQPNHRPFYRSAMRRRRGS
jgi:hypothetical protein